MDVDRGGPQFLPAAEAAAGNHRAKVCLNGRHPKDANPAWYGYNTAQ
jgi:hypothetical protein